MGLSFHLLKHALSTKHCAETGDASKSFKMNDAENQRNQLLLQKTTKHLAGCDKAWVRELGALFEIGGRGSGGC